MRIVINDIAASNGGALSVLKDFYNYIKNDNKNNWIFLLNDKYLDETENIKIITLPHIKKSKIKKLLFDFFLGKYFIKKLNPDLVLSLQNIITFGLKIPQVLYVHQAIPFQSNKNFSFFKKNERKYAIYQKLIGRVIILSIKKANKIIVQTNWMRNAIMNKTNISSKKIVKITPQIPDFFEYQEAKSFNNLSFFYPTSDAIYKNNECIIRACEMLNNDGYRDFIVKLTLPDIKNVNNVQFIGMIPRSKVINEFNTSTLIFPSYIESYGYPLIEAMKIGTIILASDCDFSREILDSYPNAYFFNPFKPEELAFLMKQIINGNIIKKEITNIYYNESKNEWECVVNELFNSLK